MALAWGGAAAPSVAGADEPSAVQLSGAFKSDLDALDGKEWLIADFAIKRASFRTAWDRRMSAVEDGRLSLRLKPGEDGAPKDFRGSEVQRRGLFGFGRYEVVMQAARGYGVISSFFTYTGPYFGDPHDEIDFEFLGRDTTKVWVTRFAAGERLPGRWIDLGFDAADAPNLYTFDWLPDRIVWFVNGREIFRVDAAERTLPTHPGRIMMSIWAGGPGQTGWSGEAPADATAEAFYHCVSHLPVGEDGPMCSDDFEAAP